MTILKWALIFLLVSIVAGVLGFTGISAASADIAQTAAINTIPRKTILLIPLSPTQLP